MDEIRGRRIRSAKRAATAQILDGFTDRATGASRNRLAHLTARAERRLRDVNDYEPPGGRLVLMKEPAATYSPRPVKAKYHRRCGA